MPVPGAKTRSEILRALQTVPSGRVVTFDMIAAYAQAQPAAVAKLLSALTEDERQTTPWYRVVAKGGAIRRGPHRDQQFAKLVREGVPVSPAGIVQDMAHIAVTALEPMQPSAVRRAGAPTSPIDASRSRGMKDRPA